MRAPTGRLFANLVTFATMLPASRPIAHSPGTALPCNVQDGVSDRVIRIGGLHPETTALIRFPALPIDTSSGARSASATNVLGPDPAAGDAFTLAAAAGPTRLYLATGPTINEGGQGVYFTVPAKMIR